MLHDLRNMGLLRRRPSFECLEIVLPQLPQVPPEFVQIDFFAFPYSV